MQENILVESTIILTVLESYSHTVIAVWSIPYDGVGSNSNEILGIFVKTIQSCLTCAYSHLYILDTVTAEGRLSILHLILGDDPIPFYGRDFIPRH